MRAQVSGAISTVHVVLIIQELVIMQLLRIQIPIDVKPMALTEMESFKGAFVMCFQSKIICS